MDLPSDTPRLPKWIFLFGDGVLLATAGYIAYSTGHPLTGVPLIAIIVLVAVGVVLGAVPFVADYARRQDEALDNRQRALQALAATVTASAEQIAIAAGGLDKLAGIAQENFSQSDRLAQQIKERMAELNASLSAAKKHDDDSAARLEAVAKKIAHAAADFEAAVARAQEPIRVAPPAQPVAIEVPPVPASQIVEIRPAVASSTSPFMAIPAPAAPAKPTPAAKAAPPPAPAPKPAPAAPPPAPAARAAPAPAPEAPAAPAPPPEFAPPKRAPRKPAPASPDLVLEPDASHAAPESAETAISADGATRLVVTAYIGIGNRLFIRGSGPGLTWDKGVPLTFVSIGRWRWETDDAAAPVKFKLYKNDEIECTALGERSVEPGAQQHITAEF